MIGVYMANEDAFEVTKGLPDVVFGVLQSEIASHLAPSSFSSIEEDVTPIGYPNESGQD